jgi:hypothetical protein
MRLRKLLDWRKLLIYSHRWMGIAIGLVVVAWCISGIILMYYGVPHLSAAERLMRLPQLDLSTVRISPGEAAALVNGEPFRLRISMHGDRPVYRINTGRVFEPMDADTAMAWLAASVPEAGTLTYEALLESPDMYTRLPAMGTHFPMHRIAVDDGAGTKYYVSANSGEAVMKSDRVGRLLGFFGYILHTFFFWRQQSWWSDLLHWLSWIAVAMAVTGAVVGVWRYGLSARFRHKGVGSHSPYVGWMKWHHYAGLIFGLVTIAWVASGLVSLNVIPGIREVGYTPDQIAAGARSVQGEGARVDLDRLTIGGMHGAVRAISPSFLPAELELLEFNGASYIMAYRPPSPDEAEAWVSRSGMDFLAPALDWDHRIVAAAGPGQHAFERFDDEAMWEAAARAMPDVGILESEWLEEFDDYYYNTVYSFDSGLMKTAKTLPVLRVKFDDPARTWLYMTPSHGQIVKAELRDRRNRWGYYGLHGLDFAFLYRNRPLWDIVTVSLLVGAGVLSSTTLIPSYRRLRRHAVRAWRRGRRRTAR